MHQPPSPPTTTTTTTTTLSATPATTVRAETGADASHLSWASPDSVPDDQLPVDARLLRQAFRAACAPESSNFPWLLPILRAAAHRDPATLLQPILARSRCLVHRTLLPLPPSPDAPPPADAQPAYFFRVFTLPHELAALATRAAQEWNALRTRVLQSDGPRRAHVSFWDVYREASGAQGGRLRAAALRALLEDDSLSRAHRAERVWALKRAFGYGLPTPFMPPFARGLYELFDAESVLDLCAGWFDRGVAALHTPRVRRYCGCDPARRTFAQYPLALHLAGGQPSDTTLEGADNEGAGSAAAAPVWRCTCAREAPLPPLQIEVHCCPLQELQLPPGQLFDLMHTSPPFFHFEVYENEADVRARPDADAWIQQLYLPLFQQCARYVRPGGRVALHIDDTSGGSIRELLLPPLPPPLDRYLRRLPECVGLRGTHSDMLRVVWIFERTALPWST